MMKKAILAAIFMCLTISMAHSAASVTVPGDFATVGAAVAAVDDGGTVTITDSAVYVGDVIINKPVKIFAATGQTPLLRNSGTTTTSPIYFGLNSGGSKLGSLEGGRIKLEFVRKATGNPLQIIDFQHTTDTLVVVENIDVACTGVTTVQSPHFSQSSLRNANQVTMRYVDVNLQRQNVSGASYGVVVGTTGGVGTNSEGRGPVYTLEKLRMNGHNRSGLWNQFRGATWNVSLCEVGVLGEKNASTNHPWGAFINNQATAPFTGRFSTSVFRSGAAGNAFWVGSQGSSVTLSRCVMLQNASVAVTAPAGALYIGANASTPLAGMPRLTVTADHCDFVDLSPVSAHQAGIATRVATGDVRTTYVLTVSNSNVYSASNKAFNASLKTGTEPDVINTDHNNVYGQGASAGYTAGTGDVSFDPMYFDAAGSDMRYSNNTLKTADSAGGPVGTNGNYANVYTSGIVEGDPGVTNRAHSWETLK